jgi:hypothetical protein
MRICVDMSAFDKSSGGKNRSYAAYDLAQRYAKAAIVMSRNRPACDMRALGSRLTLLLRGDEQKKSFGTLVISYGDLAQHKPQLFPPLRQQHIEYRPVFCLP